MLAAEVFILEEDARAVFEKDILSLREGIQAELDADLARIRKTYTAAQNALKVGELDAAGQLLKAIVAFPTRRRGMARQLALKALVGRRLEESYALTEEADSEARDLLFLRGYCQQTGQGTARDVAAARTNYRKAAEAGFAEAQYALALLLLTGQGGETDVEEAVGWLKSAAQQDLLQALRKLGQMYADGSLVPYDLKLASDYRLRAYRLGDSSLAVELGAACLVNELDGLKPGERQAFIRAAADAGNKQAEDYLAEQAEAERLRLAEQRRQAEARHQARVASCKKWTIRVACLLILVGAVCGGVKGYQAYQRNAEIKRQQLAILEEARQTCTSRFEKIRPYLKGMKGADDWISRYDTGVADAAKISDANFDAKLAAWKKLDSEVAVPASRWAIEQAEETAQARCRGLHQLPLVNAEELESRFEEARRKIQRLKDDMQKGTQGADVVCAALNELETSVFSVVEKETRSRIATEVAKMRQSCEARFPNVRALVTEDREDFVRRYEAAVAEASKLSVDGAMALSAWKSIATEILDPVAKEAVMRARALIEKQYDRLKTSPKVNVEELSKRYEWTVEANMKKGLASGAVEELYGAWMSVTNLFATIEQETRERVLSDIQKRREICEKRWAGVLPDMQAYARTLIPLYEAARAEVLKIPASEWDRQIEGWNNLNEAVLEKLIGEMLVAKRVALDGGHRAGDRKSVTLRGGVKLELVWCPSGEFEMGSPEDESSREKNETQHRVKICKGFWMGRSEVTQEQWESVMGENPSFYKGANRPVEYVTWQDCQKFCQQAGQNLRLPTEVEWEYACRAGSSTPYAGSGELDEMGWTENNSENETHDVGQKTANAWGLFDMHGNVWEWCQDEYHAVRQDGNPDSDARSGTERVRRGGSFCFDASDCRSARRKGLDPERKGNNIGFRVCCFDK